MLILILQAEKDKLSWSSGFALQEHPKKTHEIKFTNSEWTKKEVNHQAIDHAKSAYLLR